MFIGEILVGVVLLGCVIWLILGPDESDYTEHKIRTLTEGMTTEKWKRIPPELVKVNDLIPIQERDRPRDPNKKTTGDIAIYCVKFRGNIYIEDGHTRYYQALDRGDLTIAARCYRVA